MKSVITFFRGVATEAGRTKWLNPFTALGHTGIVILLSLVIGYYLGLFDHLFTGILQMFIV